MQSCERRLITPVRLTLTDVSSLESVDSVDTASLKNHPASSGIEEDFDSNADSEGEEMVEIYANRVDDGLADMGCTVYAYNARNNKSFVVLEQTRAITPPKRVKMTSVEWKCFEQSHGILRAFIDSMKAEQSFIINAFHIAGRVHVDTLRKEDGYALVLFEAEYNYDTKVVSRINNKCVILDEQVIEALDLEFERIDQDCAEIRDTEPCYVNSDHRTDEDVLACRICHPWH